MSVTINGTTGITSVNGSAAAPSVTGADTDTGIVYGTNTLSLATGGTTAVTVDSSQNVGIGTSSPAEKCHIYAASGNAFYKFQNAATGSGASDGGFVGIGGSGDVFLYNYEASNLIFATNNAERARIDSSGSLLVGATSATFGGVTLAQLLDARTRNSGYGLGIVGNASNTQIQRFFYDTTAVGSINVSGSATTYSTSSDYRLKENVQPMTGALSVVQQLKPCKYKWKVDGSDGQGFIAHELQAVVPDCVIGEKDAVQTYIDEEGNEQTAPIYQGIDTSFLVATLTAAIQELKAELDAAKADIAALKAPQ